MFKILVLGIDSGKTSMGLAVVEDGEVLATYTAKPKGYADEAVHLTVRFSAIRQIIKEYKVGAVFVEEPHYGRMVRSAYVQGLYCGISVAAAASMDCACSMLKVPQWHKLVGLKGPPKGSKERAVAKGREIAGNEALGEDEAEAVCIAVAGERLLNGSHS